MLQTIMPPSVLQIKRKIQTTKKNYVTQSTFLQNKNKTIFTKMPLFPNDLV